MATKNTDKKSAKQTKGKGPAKKTSNSGKGKVNNKSKSQNSSSVKEKKPANYRVRAIILLALAVLSFCLLFIKGNFVWSFISNSIYGIFGGSAVLISVSLLYIAIMTAKEKEVHRLKAKVGFCALTVFLVCTLWYIFSGYQKGNYFVELGHEFMAGFNGDSFVSRGGGLFGALLGYPMSYGLGNTISVILLVLLILVLLLIITGVSLLDIAKAARKPMEKAMHQAEIRKQERIEKEKQRELEKPDEEESLVPTYNGPIDIPLDGPIRKKKKDNSFNKNKNTDNSDTNANADTSLAKQRDETDNLIDIIKKANQQIEDDNPSTLDVIKENVRKEKTQALKDAAKLANRADEIIDETEALNKEIKEYDTGTHSDYQFPPVQLLNLAHNTNSANIHNELQEKAEKLVSTLDSFGVKVTITNICRGPSVTRYEIQPAPGVKISKITNLADDIALNLAANGVRIEAPIPGKAAVGIEVPNKVVSMVSMRELIDSDEFRNAKSKLTCVLGRDISGEIVTTDLAAMPHLLIAGTTGSGKSVCVNSLLMSILYRATPDEVKFLLIDPKMVEFSKYKGIPHLLIPVVFDSKKAAASLNWAVSEMDQRYNLFSEYDCKDINSYNELIESNLKYISEQDVPEGEEPDVLEVNGLPVRKEKMFRCVIAIDELADLMMTAPSEVEESICRLAQKARAAGMHLVIATQRPSVNVITGVIKANIPSRISLKVSSNIDSRTILDFGGAEKLIGKGDMLYSPVGAPKPIRVQGCFASDKEIEGVTRYIKNHHRSQYNEEVEARIKKITVDGMDADNKDNNGDLDLDEKIEEAIKIVIDAGQASTSLVQRRLKVGYARAGRMIDEMESLGIVGPHQGSKPREVLMTYQDWLERKNNLGKESEEETSQE